MQIMGGFVAVLIGALLFFYGNPLRIGVVVHKIVCMDFNFRMLLSCISFLTLVGWGYVYWFADIVGLLCMPFTKKNLRRCVGKNCPDAIWRTFGCGVVYLLLWIMLIAQLYMSDRVFGHRDLFACRVLILEGLIWFVAYLLTGMQVVPRLYFVVKFRRNGVRFTSRMYGERYFLIVGSILLLMHLFYWLTVLADEANLRQGESQPAAGPGSTSQRLHSSTRDHESPRTRPLYQSGPTTRSSHLRPCAAGSVMGSLLMV